MPIPIPPADEGWKNMRRKLDAAMPVTRSGRRLGRAATLKLALGAAAAAACAALILYSLRQPEKRPYRLPAPPARTQPVPPQAPQEPQHRVSQEITQTDTRNLTTHTDTPTSHGSNITVRARNLSPQNNTNTTAISTIHQQQGASIYPSSSPQPDAGKAPETAVAAASSGVPATAVPPIHAPSSTAADSSNSANTLQTLPLFKQRDNKALSAAAAFNIHFPKIKARPAQGWMVMLQWQWPIPFKGAAAYTMGPDGSSQPYRLLYPGIRLQRQLNRSALSLDLTPFASQLYPDRPYMTNNAPPGNSSLLKKFGHSAAIQFHRQLYERWHASAGIQAWYWQQATIRRFTQDSMQQRETYYADKKDIFTQVKRLQWGIAAETYYDANKWQAGLRASFPVSKQLADTIGNKLPKAPVQVEVIFRYKLPFGRKNKKITK